MATDVLSDVLRAVRLTGAVYFDFDLSSPWVLEAPPSRDIAATVMPGAEHVIEYHLIARGSAWGHAVGQPPIHLREGDLIVFPQGDAHVMSSAPGMRAAVDLSPFTRGSRSLPLVYQMGGGGPDRARIVCCFLGCDERPFNPLLKALPGVIHLAAAEAPATAGWLGTLLHMAAVETSSARPTMGSRSPASQPVSAAGSVSMYRRTVSTNISSESRDSTFSPPARALLVSTAAMCSNVPSQPAVAGASAAAR